jgi:hypothetical protein
MEEDVAPPRRATPRWHDEYTKSTMTLNSFILSTTTDSEAFQWMYHEDGGRGG